MEAVKIQLSKEEIQEIDNVIAKIPAVGERCTFDIVPCVRDADGL